MDLKRLEEIALLAWPALRETIYDGWILRFSEGYTKRANSVIPLHISSVNLEEKIPHCERIFQERDLPPIFRITPFASPKIVDGFLEARGYEKIDPTWVLTLNLIDLDLRPPYQDDFHSIHVDQWLDVFCAFRGDALDDHQTHKKILQAIPKPKLFAALHHENQPVACCVGSLVDGNIGMFDLLTAPDHRREGFATSLVLSMLSWAQERGARLAYLQVVESNQAALGLYRKLGFEKAYSYWYRKTNLQAKNIFQPSKLHL